MSLQQDKNTGFALHQITTYTRTFQWTNTESLQAKASLVNNANDIRLQGLWVQLHAAFTPVDSSPVFFQLPKVFGVLL